MADNKTFSYYAVLYELNNREFKKKLDLFPEELRYYAMLANGIIGSENAKRLKETPEAIVKNSREFVEKLLGQASPETDEVFRRMLETYLIETLKDELRCCCLNCADFNSCLDMENPAIGLLFQRRVNGEETDELKREISLQVEKALRHTPYINTDKAHKLCKDFRHQYSSSNIGEVFGRYSDIAAGLRMSFGIDYRKIQQEIISINMEFCKKFKG